FRDESMHMSFAFKVVDTVRAEEPDLFDDAMKADIIEMLKEAVECEVAFAEDVLAGGVHGLSIGDMRLYLESIADARAITLGLAPIFGSQNPLGFMELQDVQELTNFFE